MDKTKKDRQMTVFFSDPAGVRTQDPNIKSVVLYQLSYGIIFANAGANIRASSNLTSGFQKKTPKIIPPTYTAQKGEFYQIKNGRFSFLYIAQRQGFRKPLSS